MRIYKRVIDFDTSVETIRTLVRVFLAVTTLRNRLSLVSCFFLCTTVLSVISFLCLSLTATVADQEHGH
jgi:hypothetical protein